MKRSEYLVPAIKSAVYFFVFGFFWILLSDRFLNNLELPHALEAELQTYKGWLFIALTTVLIYFLVEHRIREILKLKNKLQLNETSLSAILENIGEGIISIDKSNTILYMNSIAEKLTGFSATEAQNKSLDKILNIVVSKDHHKIKTLLFNDSEPLTGPDDYLILIAENKHEYRINLTRKKIFDEHHAHVSTIIAFHDITEKKNLEIELQSWLDVYSSFIKYSIEGVYLLEFKKPIPITLHEDEQISGFYENTILRTCNDAFAILHGYRSADEIDGINIKDLPCSFLNPANQKIFKKLINSDYRLLQETTEEKSKTGETIFISNNLVGIKENGQLVRIWGSQFDITDQVKALKVLEESEKKYKLLFQTTPIALIIYDLENFEILDANHSAEILYGYNNREFTELKIWDIRPDFELYTAGELRQWVMDNLRNTSEYTTKNKSGQTIHVEIKRDQIEYLGKPAVLAAINDISALKEAEKRVIQSVVEGENNERKRISKELHDSLGQSLTAASLNFSAVKNDISNLEPQKAEKFQLGLDFLNAAIEESRNIAHNLMPKAIDDFGLVPSLNSLFNQVDKFSGINIKFYENLEGRRLPRQVEFNLYRITQEALNNAIKHAHPTEIFVQLILHQNDLIYTFEDDGKGFIVDPQSLGKRGLGLASIDNRVKAMSGTLEIDSSPKRGTAITIELPV
jgi:PAS domain S-box-containing protein